MSNLICQSSTLNEVFVNSCSLHIGISKESQYDPESISLIERKNIKNLETAIINNLYITFLFNITDMSIKEKSQLRKLLSNKNIKKLNINIGKNSNDKTYSMTSFLIYITKLIKKNNSIKEIDLKIEEFPTKNLNSIQIKALYNFIEAIVVD